MENEVLGERYKLIRKIGSGGMADVYKAECQLLNRFVAIKILKSEYTEDEEFVKRFRIEAQSAASLSHPNIVPIYDVGHQGNIHYIVMEYVDGITLKEYITNNGAIPWQEAINVSVQVCSAMEHAHRNHIIHRDIKPHNILITGDGIAKVSDFGIARASSASTITIAGNTMGSVHYFSPEQARGGFMDEKSDIYSLGIVMYEMITGRVPFDGDTPVTVALKQIQVEPTPPNRIKVNIPVGVNSIILNAMTKNPSGRYQSASAMLKDLYDVLETPGQEFTTQNLNESHGDCPTKRIPAVNFKFNFEDNENKKQSVPDVKKSDKKLMRAALIASIAVMGIVLFLTIRMILIPILSSDSPEAKEFVVENYVGRNFNDVKNELLQNNIGTVKDLHEVNETTPKDIIISQSIPKGEKLKAGSYSSIEFRVSDGPNLVEIPDVTKLDYRQAINEITSKGLVPQIVEDYNDDFAVDIIFSVSPSPGFEVKPGTTITIYKSKGHEDRITVVPNLIGKTRVEALKSITDAKLTVNKIYPENSSNAVDKVTRQIPESGSGVLEGVGVSVYLGYSKIVTNTINLSNPSRYGNRIKVLIESTTQGTGNTKTVMNEYKLKSEFPLKFNLSVQSNTTTKISVSLDGKPYAEFTEN